jgi:hypothetical protein
MPAESLRQLFVEELRDMYDGEKQLKNGECGDSGRFAGRV